MADSVIDFASLDAAAAAATTPAAEPTEVTTPAVDTKTTDASKDQINPDGTPKTATEETNADGTPKEKTEDLPGSETTPQNVRQALKTLRDSDPKNAAVVKELHGSYERWNAAKAIFPKGVNEMKEAKTFMETVGGHEGFDKLQDQVTAINESDTLLYSGDGKLVDNIVEDLKSQGKLDALGKLAPSFLDALKTNDRAGYYNAFAPHFLSALQEVELPDVFDGLATALAKGGEEGIAQAKKITQGVTEWYKGLQTKAEKTKAEAINPERLKLEEDRKTLQKQQEDFKTGQTKQFQEGVARDQEKISNSVLGTDLKGYLAKPFFKGYSKENLIPLGNQIKSDLYATLKADKAYQSQMKAMWAAKSPDKAKIVEYHKAKLESISADTVRNAVQRMYPGYAKGGEAAGRAAAAVVKKETETKANQTAAATGKPQYVAVKPNWDDIDWTKDPKEYSYIAGKAYLKVSGKYVTWRK